MSDKKNEVDISKLTFEQLKKIREYLKKLIDNGGSDLHVKSKGIIRARVNGSIVPFSGSVLSYEDAMTLAKELLRGRFSEFVQNKEIDLVYQFDEGNRFRVNIFFQTDGPSFVFRIIPMQIPTIDQMKFPEIVRTLTKEGRGLVLVTGATGSGKSTTLAAMIHEINLTEKKHIVTIEDPIEFVHKDRGCVINQRSVGQDTLSFGRALRAALREDPDIILVGEMRDRETVELALHAADTGHLVFSTLHTIDAKETINRIIAMFPNEEQNRVRLSLSGVLKGVVSQRLIPTIDGKRVAAMEVLVKTPTIEKLILENRDYEIRDAIEKGREHYKSQSFDQHILDIYNQGIITKEKAKDYATSAADLELKMSGFNSGKASDFANMAEKKSKQEFSDDEVFDLK
ncbi:MAG: type IV pili twitching motility protein PilT [Sulfurimonas sp. RIFOXYD12_FULL_36_11]|jgi:twitching motility protein PilT|uniref:type IV pilus twitching motility protein PilT n=1 Tax=unclassified Sulfurimonas TaxID=2623549 RepID=UPI0008AB3FBC|nr:MULTISPECIES: PilT/PilU family type 4a pilus ATPase [unclassified Sulfurimonas]OHE08292.1 MAG: type IV pili twitching motility protein PilT [Sulfurimonas sp. RIFOXYC2_FULL_36_7]OHE11264.1 MAG: type IV pili twitching motility protein PilT [Sulfurimonas sp. RIFOXYD12_FULL_36_11]MBS4067896.1 PilT/PilU family type 4a pilus ATPase [Sulfurimonas sp.]MDD3856345.1 PilT/PilU family type 4a pilus ATPase [Sulfurimonas sp.]OHE04342.1 MAG: type IV pili twitching motility protein PilT [Sulfurimonas sp. R